MVAQMEVAKAAQLVEAVVVAQMEVAKAAQLVEAVVVAQLEVAKAAQLVQGLLDELPAALVREVEQLGRLEQEAERVVPQVALQV